MRICHCRKTTLNRWLSTNPRVILLLSLVANPHMDPIRYMNSLFPANILFPDAFSSKECNPSRPTWHPAVGAAAGMRQFQILAQTKVLIPISTMTSHSSAAAGLDWLVKCAATARSDAMEAPQFATPVYAKRLTRACASIPRFREI